MRSLSILPGTQAVMPISRFVSVSFRPASSVRRSTLASTGKVLRLLTARLTTCNPPRRGSPASGKASRPSSSLPSKVDAVRLKPFGRPARRPLRMIAIDSYLLIP